MPIVISVPKYDSVTCSWFAALGIVTRVEDASSHGRLDMDFRFSGNVYLFEFKVVELAPEGAAMVQSIHLVAVQCSKETRNLVAAMSHRWSDIVE